MRRAITICRTPDDIARFCGAWEAQRSTSWALTILVPTGTDTTTLPHVPGVTVTDVAGPPIVEALRLAAQCDAAWLLREGRAPETGSLASIEHWLSVRSTDVMYGDSVDEGGIVTTRPRFGRIRMLATGDVGDSIIVRGELAKAVLDRGTTEWHATVMALIAEARTVDHIPVVLDAGPAHPRLSTTARAALLSPANPEALLSGDGHHIVPGEPVADEQVTIVIPSIGTAASFGESDRPALLACLESILSRDTSLVKEIIVVAGPRMPGAVVDAAQVIAGDLLKIVDIGGDFSFSASCNTGAAHASGTHNLFLNDDVEVVTDDWLALMMRVALGPGVGAVGARLLFPDGYLQHCGITVRPDTCEPNHLYYRADPAEVSDPSASACSEYLAVTGACLLVSRENFESVGGFSLRLPLNYNDVDLCLKLKRAGLVSVSCNPVTLLHRESTSRVPTLTQAEADEMQLWRGEVQDDPYWYAWS
ncbi:glycosyltransferase [Flaviflexus huanghaiensis]|uniref:glycosyltransferase n=1 Tax=Flaviflexus huanghaiensis TaxID=1111473 RepID=UPI0015FA993E|nr:glycosyltransferase family 2 protein [Flaviflexus huanghaiensis]